MEPIGPISGGVLDANGSSLVASMKARDERLGLKRPSDYYQTEEGKKMIAREAARKRGL